MRRGFEVILEVRMERLAMLREWRRWVGRIAGEFARRLGEVEVYVFGSVAEGRWHGGSDVDVLVVSDRVPGRLGERYRLWAEVWEALGLPLNHPFEIHIADRREAEFYKRHAGSMLRIR